MIILKRMFLTTSLICWSLFSANYAKSSIGVVIRKADTIIKPVNVEALIHSKDVDHANVRRIFRLDSVYNNQMRAEILAAQAPGYKSPELIAQEAREHMNDELMKDGLSEKGNPSGYTINAIEFIVNGVKQPDSVFKKYRALSNAANTFNSIRSMYFRNHILVQMVKDNLIGNGNFDILNVSYTLNGDEFIVNGVKQPPAIFQKYYNEFSKAVPGGKINWRHSFYPGSNKN